jgi:hypothetical protein
MSEENPIGAVGVVQWPGQAHVCTIKELKHTEVKIMATYNLVELRPDDGGPVKKGWTWLAAWTENEVGAKEGTAKRCHICASEEEAVRIATEWNAELEAKKKALKEQHEKGSPAELLRMKPPETCTRITKADLNDHQHAIMTVLRKQYPKVFAIMEEIKGATGPAQKALREKAKDAYVLDVAANTGMVLKPTADPKFIMALAGAMRKRNKPIDAIDYDLSLNWIPGRYCFMSAKELADHLNKTHGTAHSPGLIKKRRERLGLVTKRRTGPDSKG